jgi:excisionase family DNA binding protein
MKMNEACKVLGVAPDTLRRWEKEGLIHFERTPLGYRIFKEEMIPQLQQIIKERTREKRGE